jgi:hypothetical protein
VIYDAQKVRFEQAPPSIGRFCRDLRGEKFWLYAYWKEADTEYFVLSNRKSEVSGVGVVLRGTECATGLPDWVLTGDARNGGPDKVNKPVRFSDTVLHGLALDVLRRYTAAFGGKKNFLQAVRMPPHSGPSYLEPVLRSEFEKFAREPSWVGSSKLVR